MKISARDSRGLLRAAIVSRDAARTHRDETTGTLRKADTVLAAQRALAHAEHEQATTIAQGIRSGENPDTVPTAAIKSAHATLLECESRVRMAKQARDQIADELKLADAELVEAEAALNRAAEAVITAEIEGRCNLDRINQAIATLIEVDELVFGLGYLWTGGKPLKPSQNLQAIFARLEPLRAAVAMMRPDRPILSPPIEQMTMQRFDAYRKALTDNPDAQLTDIAKPVCTPPKPPPSRNMVEDGRMRSAQAWATALGRTNVVSVGR
jgi:hypothetical protein